MENGSHDRREVSLGEDASRIGGRTRAHVMASLRHRMPGLYERRKARRRTRAQAFLVPMTYAMKSCWKNAARRRVETSQSGGHPTKEGPC